MATLRAILLFLAIACAAHAAVWAPAAAITTTGSSPVLVSRCEPVEGQTSLVGYAPGYYPFGPYYWRDPYGYWYHQYGMPPSVYTSAPTLSIDYQNTNPSPLREIEFGLVARGNLIAEVRDVGKFTQGAEIKHTFGLNPNVFPIGTGLPQCVPLKVTYQDGRVWLNPRLPKLRESLYEE